MGPGADTHNLNTRLLRFRSQPGSHAGSEEAIALASDLLLAGRYGDARGVAIGAQADDAPDARLLLIEARAWYFERDLVRAQQALLRGVQADPTFGDAFRLLGEVLLKRGDPERALRALQRASVLQPGDSEVERLLTRAEQLAKTAASAREPAPVVASVPPAPVPISSRAPVSRSSSAGHVAAPAQPERFRPAPPSPVWPGRPQSPVPAAPVSEDAPTSSFRREHVDQAFADFSDGTLDAPHVPSSAGAFHAPAAPAARSSSPGTQTAAGRASAAGVFSSPGVHSSPGSRTSPGMQSVPGSISSPGTRSAAGNVTAPGSVSSPGTRSAAGKVSAPGLFSSPGAQSSPGTRTAPGTRSAPGTSTAPGSQSSPGTSTAPGSQSAPGLFSSPGSYSVPGTRSAPGTSTAPGTQSVPGTRTSPGQQRTPAAFPAPAPNNDRLFGDDDSATMVNPAIPASKRAPSSAGAITAPGVTTAPGLGATPAPSEWVGALSTSPGLAETPASSSEDVDLMWETPASSHDDDAFEPEPAIGSGPLAEGDVPVGQRYGMTEDPERLLLQLRDQGVLETDAMSVAETNPAWTPRSELPRARVGRTLTVLWVSTLVLLGGGYFGFQQWVKLRHGQAAELLAQARDAAWDGDQAQLVEAERLLNAAREKNPRSAEIPERALLLQAQRLLENGSRELSALRIATARAKQASASPAHVQLAEALLAAFGGGADGSALVKASELARTSPTDKNELLYVAGRAEQRLGQSGALERLQAVAAESPKLLAAALALAEIAHVEGRTQDALAQVERVLAARKDHLRARLWRSYLSADTQEPEAALTELAQLESIAKDAAPIDRLLVALSKARVLQRKGEREAAAQAVSGALATGTNEPSLLALLAVEAERTGQLGVAAQAARAALSAAPSSPTYRALLARILLARRDASSALALLAELPPGDPNIVLLRARAALGSDDLAQQRDALAALDAQLTAAPDAPSALQAKSLKLRLQASLEPNAKLVREAEKLAQRAPGDAGVLQALGEVALAASDVQVAKRALEQLVASAPDDADAYCLLGRARRMALDAKGAEDAFVKALTLSPGHVDASIALGALLLDSGRYADADALYQQLASTSPLAARLGRVEALTGLGKHADAGVQLQGIPEAQRSSPVARETAARLALASGKPGEAVTLLSGLMQAEKRSPLALALYGEALYGVDQVDASAGAFEAALELDADLPEALIGRAEVHLRAERADDALELLEQAQEALSKRLRAPEWHARALTAIGHAHVMRGKRNDLESARNALIKALELQGVPSEAYFWRGEADGGRRTPEAAAAFKKYLELEPNGRYADRAKKALGPLL